MPNLRLLCLLTTLLIATAPAAGEYPDLILHNGDIYTGIENAPFAEAVAVTGQRISAIGSRDSVLATAGPDTRYIDLGYRMAMPGIIDSHMHPLQGGLKVLYECNFPFTATPDEIAATVADCVAAAPPGAWIKGGQWDSDFFVNHPMASPRKFLDRISGDYAVVLEDDSGHNAWVNSRALALIGITADTPDPEGGSIEREAGTQRPNGVLLETAWVAFSKQVPEPSAAQHFDATLKAQAMLLSYGITGVKIARAFDAALLALRAAEQQGRLTMHVAACLETPYGKRDQPLDIAALKQTRTRFASPHVYTNAVKIFLDGVPTASRTALMVEPYAADAEHGAGYHGESHLEPELLARDVAALDREGFAIKIHAAGDGSVRAALDAFSHARRANGPGGARHEIAHAGFVTDSDVPRFKALNVAPDFSPFLWHPSPIIDSVVGAVGPRGREYWPTRTLMAAGATIIAGSDWPSAVASPNPWLGIEALITREDPEARYPDSLMKDEAITLEEALTLFTVNGAETLGLEGRVGRLAPGYSADIIVLDRNLFRVSPREIGQTEVLLTVFEGKPVHAAGEFSRFVPQRRQAASGEGH